MIQFWFGLVDFYEKLLVLINLIFWRLIADFSTVHIEQSEMWSKGMLLKPSIKSYIYIYKKNQQVPMKNGEKFDAIDRFQTWKQNIHNPKKICEVAETHFSGIQMLWCGRIIWILYKILVMWLKKNSVGSTNICHIASKQWDPQKCWDCGCF